MRNDVLNLTNPMEESELEQILWWRRWRLQNN